MTERTWQSVNITIPASSCSTEVDTTCPECSPSRKKKGAKCLSVNTEKGTWICHHCAWRGSLKSGVDGASNPWTWKPKVYTKPAYPIGLPMTPAIEAWFAKRGISLDTLAQYQISSGCVYMPQTEQFEDVIQFPYFREGELVNVKYRMVEQKEFRMVGGAERLLYGLDTLEGATTAIICEGECDVLALFGCGIPAVSVPDGAPTPGSKGLETKLNYLNTPALESLTKIILMTDNDAPGVFLQQELIRRLGAERCWTVTYPDGCKDPNDVLLTHGLTGLQAMLAQAVQVPIAGVVNLRTYDAPLYALYEEGMPSGVSTGWPSVDLIYTVKPGRLTIWTGEPGSGKSNVLDTILIAIAKAEDWRFAVFSPENYPPESHILRLIEKAQGKSGRIHSENRLSQAELQQGRDWIGEHFWFFGTNDDETPLTLDTLLQQAKLLVRREGVRGVVLDPWTDIEHAYGAGMTEVQYLSQSLTKIRQFARYHGVHFWVVAHPTKMYRDASGKFPSVELYDISGGAMWRNRADFGIVTHRTDDCTELYVKKVRFREEGQLGMKRLKFNHTSGGFEEDREHVNTPAF